MRASSLFPVASLVFGAACANEVPSGSTPTAETATGAMAPTTATSAPEPAVAASLASMPDAAAASPVASAPPAPPAPWAAANQDPDDDGVVGPPAALPDCMDRLTALGVTATAAQLAVHKEGGKTCGSPQVVVYKSGPTALHWSSPPMVTCQVALGLSHFEEIAKDEAQKELGTTIKRVIHIGTYSCRPMVRFNLASEHSYANAIDIEGFDLANGKHIRVEKDWGNKEAPPATPEARFLRTLARRTYDDATFSVVLGPPWDALHKNHLHMDQARYRVDGLLVP